nr:unnamed protein product [Callosobruchus chinensis]
MTYRIQLLAHAIANRKNLPIIPNKLKNKGDYEFWCSNSGLLTAKWKDTKEVLAMSLHNPANSSMSENIFQLKVLPGADATVAMQIRLKEN